MTREEILQIAKPILFNTDMVQAILDDRKTTTRRLVKPRYRDDEFGFRVVTNKATGVRYLEKTDENEMGFDTPRYINPPYQVGDILYVRETWEVQAAKRYDAIARIVYRAGGPMTTMHFPNGCSDSINRIEYDDFVNKWSPGRWRPSIHMPKEAARIFLRVTDIRVERLQDIDDEGAKAEGANFRNGKNVGFEEKMCRSAVERFAEIWDATIKKKDLGKYGWTANSWVWVIEFERCEVLEV